MKFLFVSLFLVLSCGKPVVPVCEPAPIANAGPEAMIVQGLGLPESVQIGTPAIEGQSYSWSPAIGLSDAKAAQPMVQISDSQEYVLTVSNKCGSAQSKVVVSVYAEVVDP